MLKFRLLFALLFLTLGFSAANAQNDADAPKQQFDEPRRPQLLRELGLRQEQVRQIRIINGENKEKLREAKIQVNNEVRGRTDNRDMPSAILLLLLQLALSVWLGLALIRLVLPLIFTE